MGEANTPHPPPSQYRAPQAPLKGFLPLDLTPYLSLLLRALKEDFGVKVSSPHILRLKARLYAAMQTDKSTFGSLSIRTSQTDPHNEIWIVQQKESQGPAELKEFEP